MSKAVKSSRASVNSKNVILVKKVSKNDSYIPHELLSSINELYTKTSGLILKTKSVLNGDDGTVDSEIDKRPALIVIIQHSGSDHSLTHDDEVKYYYRALSGDERPLDVTVEEKTYQVNDGEKVTNIKKSFVDDYRRKRNYFGPLQASVERKKVIENGKEREIVRTLVTQIRIISQDNFNHAELIPGYIPECSPSSVERKGFIVYLDNNEFEIPEKILNEFRCISGIDKSLQFSVKKSYTFLNGIKVPTTAIQLYVADSSDLFFPDLNIKESSMLGTDLKSAYHTFAVHATKSIRSVLNDGMCPLRKKNSTLGVLMLNNATEMPYEVRLSFEYFGIAKGIYLYSISRPEEIESTENEFDYPFVRPHNLNGCPVEVNPMTLWLFLLKELEDSKTTCYSICETSQAKWVEVSRYSSYKMNSEPICDISLKFVYDVISNELCCYIRCFGRLIKSGMVFDAKELYQLLSCLNKCKKACIGFEVDAYLCNYSSIEALKAILEKEACVVSHPFLAIHSFSCKGVVIKPISGSIVGSVKRGSQTLHGELLICEECAELDKTLTKIILDNSKEPDDSSIYDGYLPSEVMKQSGETKFDLKTLFKNDLKSILDKRKNISADIHPLKRSKLSQDKSVCVSINMPEKEFYNLMKFYTPNSRKDTLFKECKICGVKCQSMLSLLCHLKEHLGELKAKCNECGIELSKENLLSDHKREFHETDQPVCFICKLKFSTRQELYDHLNIHRNLTPIVCEKCCIKLTDLSSYKKHLYSVHNLNSVKDLNIICKVCGSYFFTKDYLLIHSLNTFHDTVYSLSCDICNFKCSTISTFKSHLIRHTEEERKSVNIAICSNCGKSFISPYRLLFHLEKCQQQKKEIITKADKNSEINIKLYSEKYECKRCKSYFKSKKELDCHYCGFDELATNSANVFHNVLNSFSQNETFRSFNNKVIEPKQATINNIVIKTAAKMKQLQCSLCGRKFGELSALNKHLLIHEGDDPVYQCEECGYVFGEQDEILQHIQIDHAEVVQRHQQELMQVNQQQLVLPNDNLQIAQLSEEQLQALSAGDLTALRLITEEQTQEAVYNLLHLTDF